MFIIDFKRYQERTEYLKQYEFECDCIRCEYFRGNPKMAEIEEKFNIEVARILQTVSTIIATKNPFPLLINLSLIPRILGRVQSVSSK
jgi:hypothetical protein